MKILFGIFDWGLGHATRDIPLITELLKSNKVHIISTGRALKLIQDYFGQQCKYHDVPSVYSPYTRTPFFKTKLTITLPMIIRSLRKARRESKIITEQGFDKVISDCRYDVYDKLDNSFFITHQVRFKTPFGFQRVVERWLGSWTKKYRFVIVPDYEESDLTGLLSHNLRYISKDRIRYVGILSHIKKMQVSEDIDYLISISGPEPQRTVFFKRIMLQVNQLAGKIVVAGGTPDISQTSNKDNVLFYSFLNSMQQEEMMNRAKFIISRAGYTTVMEIAELGKKNILFLPTPGMSEQEYLADYYEEKRYFHHVSQYRLSLKEAIKDSKDFNGVTVPWKTEKSVRNFMEVINS